MRGAPAGIARASAIALRSATTCSTLSQRSRPMPRPQRACSKLGATQLDEVEVNARVRDGADDGRDRPLHRRALRRAGRGIPRSRPPGAGWARHVLIHSAPLGPVGALDRIPAYRLGAGVSLPGVAPLRAGVVRSRSRRRLGGSVAAVRARPALGGLRGARAGAGIRPVGVRAGRERRADGAPCGR